MRPRAFKSFSTRAATHGGLWCCLVLMACPSRPSLPIDEDAGLSGPPEWADGSVEVGASSVGSNGEAFFVPLAAESELHPGSQGGFHLPLLFRVTNSMQTFATFDVKVRRARDGLLLSTATRSFEVRTRDAGPWTSYEVPIFFCPTPAGVTVDGEQVTFEVTVTRDPRVLLTVAHASTVLRCAAGNSFCRSICSG